MFSVIIIIIIFFFTSQTVRERDFHSLSNSGEGEWRRDLGTYEEGGQSLIEHGPTAKAHL